MYLKNLYNKIYTYIPITNIIKSSDFYIKSSAFYNLKTMLYPRVNENMNFMCGPMGRYRGQFHPTQVKKYMNYLFYSKFLIYTQCIFLYISPQPNFGSATDDCILLYPLLVE